MPDTTQPPADPLNSAPVTITSITARWTNPASRPLFKGKLIDDTGCKCAQGDVLSCAGYSDQYLRNLSQRKADREVANILGISLIHSVLLRVINDKKEGAPQDVLVNPGKILGKNAELILGLWWATDAAAYAADAAAYDAAAYADAAEAEAVDAAIDAAAYAADYAAYSAAAYANVDANVSWMKYKLTKNCTYELIGMDILKAQGKLPYFLAFLGYKTWESTQMLAVDYPWRTKARF